MSKCESIDEESPPPKQWAGTSPLSDDSDEVFDEDVKESSAAAGEEAVVPVPTPRARIDSGESTDRRETVEAASKTVNGRGLYLPHSVREQKQLEVKLFNYKKSE